MSITDRLPRLPRLPSPPARPLLVACLALLTVGVAAVFLVEWAMDDPTAARRRAAAVTEADNGDEITVAPSQTFIVDLEGSPEAAWTLPQATTEALARVSTSQDLDGSAAATFLPLEVVSEATITAERVPSCRKASPACNAPSERFEVTIRVAG